MFFVILVINLILYVNIGHTKEDNPAKNNELLINNSNVSNVDDKVQRIVHEGIAVEFSIGSAETEKETSSELVEGKEAWVQFKITDTVSNTPVSALSPAAWMDMQIEENLLRPTDCKDKVAAFLRGDISARAEINMNSFYVLALNDNATISVVDPLFGYGGSKLLAMVSLESPGMDWVLTKDHKILFVSMPKVNKVAVIDTTTWKVKKNIEVGHYPGRLALQPDEKYLWACNFDPNVDSHTSGVAVIDTEKLKVVKYFKTGKGRHEIAFSDGDQYSFITSEEDGILSIIDIQNLSVLENRKIGKQLASLAYSALSQSVYITDVKDGNIIVVDAQNHKELKRIKADAGLGMIKFSPDGRLGFIVNPLNHFFYVLDTATNSIVQTANVKNVLGQSPDQIAITEFIVYIRSRDSEHVLMLPLDKAGKEGAVPLIDFSGGENPLGKTSNPSIANTIVPSQDGTSVLVANPADKMIYYYKEGMAAPMGSFKNYGFEPRAVMVVDRSLREVSPGIYSTYVHLSRSGDFDVVFFLDSPRIVHCFDVAVKPDPMHPNQLAKPKIKIEPILKNNVIQVGNKLNMQFKVIDTKNDKPVEGIEDLGILTFSSSGDCRKRYWSKEVKGGLYQIDFIPPKPGPYYVFLNCPSYGIKLNQLPYFILHAAQ